MSNNCPFCPEGYKYESWGLSPEGWEEAKRNHKENHICKECGQEKVNNFSLEEV